MRSWTTVDDDTKTKAGTVGDDMLTVHKLITEYDDGGEPYLLTACETGRKGGKPTEWLRPVNCPPCLATPTE
ncbi:hypothetical protein [Streptomyces nitrosporeus]|uniref:hypothetical protein n=1 Tax=Streptomyces nitrosporeus TaxID=28894 RepID=UPI00332F29E0